MNSLRRRFRGFALIWGVVQVILPMIVLLGDASGAKAGALRATVHVEATSSANCTRAHTDDCALCRFLSQNNAQPACADSSQPPERTIAPPKDAPRVSIAAAHWKLPASRAPPAV
jgi:hypothetical protein